MVAFAKLSGSLLDSNQRLPADDGAVGSTEVARLYDELRDCIAANDQEGVQRIFGELVRAQRPISEISAIVEGLSRPEATQRPEAARSPVPEEPPLPSNVLAFEQGRPEVPAHEPGEERDTETIEPANLPAVDRASAAEESAFNRPDDEQSEQAEGDVLPEENPRSGVTAPLEPQDAWSPLEDEPELSSDPDIGLHSTEIDAGSRLAAMRETLQHASFPTAEPGTSNYGLASRPAVAADVRPAFLSPRAFIYAASVVVAIIVAAGTFFLMRPTGKEAASVAANGPANVSAASTPGAGSTPSKSAPAEKPAQPAAAPPIPTAPAAAGAEQPAKVNPIAAPLTPEPAPSSRPAMAVPVAPTAATDRPETKPAPPNEPAEKKAAASSAAEDPAATAPTPRRATDAASASADRPETKPALASLGPPNDAVPIGRPAPAPADPLVAKPERETAKAAASPDTAPLLERGDGLFAVGDIASARLFYQRAAEAGDARAALRLGESYDPAFLERARLRVQGDRTLAMFWYGRARDLGASEAEILLKAMQSR